LIKRKRQELGDSQEVMAGKLGITRAHLSNIENGIYTRPSPVMLGKASKIMNIDINDLYTATGYVPYTELPNLRAYLIASILVAGARDRRD